MTGVRRKWETGRHPSTYFQVQILNLKSQNQLCFIIIIIIIIMRVIYIAPKNVKLTHRRIKSHCKSAKRMTSILRHVTEAFPPAKQGSILNSHRVIGIATSTSMVLNCTLVTYIIMTADIGLPDAVWRHTQDIA